MRLGSMRFLTNRCCRDIRYQTVGLYALKSRQIQMACIQAAHLARTNQDVLLNQYW